jgi:eukaryotic-like serine/threonine-protein kinase
MGVDSARAKSLFLAASDLGDPAERAAYLERECGGDAELRGRVEALLRANDAAPAIAQPPAEAGKGAGAHLAQPSPETEDYGDSTARVGSLVAGKYKLIEEIGAGGMGSVFMAQQTEPVKRAVAVKVVKAGMDSKAVLARFEAERQALAMMDHPNIARVLDAGTTAGGRPFFVMELVKGTPITQFCDERKLTPRQRLELFVPVCQAIQHAHQKGIIHRDIKPSNVLVAMYDDKPVPKVIDFGVAKAAGQALTEKTLMTGFGAVVGTAEYMSPEQASQNNMDIDTRSDVYSLGVLLYELLTGSTPVDRKSLGKAAILEILRIVREVEAPKPSHRLSTSEGLPNVAANRSTDPAKLSKLMKGELDWVLLKALEKDRTRRYDAANGLARDIQRYLADELVEARPPSTGYRLKKFVRRHKAQVIAASLVLCALVAGMAGTTWGLIEAKRQEAIARDEATEKEKARQAEAEQREKAEEEKKIAQSVRDFLQNKLLAQADTYPLAARELALPLFEETLKLHKAKLGLEHPDTLTSMNNLAAAYHYVGKSDLALPLFEETLKLRKAKLGPEHPDTLTTMYSLALAYQFAGKPDLALPLAEETLKLRKAKLGPEHPDTLAAMNNLANAYRAAGKLDLALPLFEQTLKLTKAKLGPEHPLTLACMTNFAIAYQAAGKLDLALPLFEETLKLMKATLGPEHPDTIRSMVNLAWTYQDAGKLDLALPLFEETLKLRKAMLGPEHPATIFSMNILAQAYQDAGRLDLALPLFEQTLNSRKAMLGPEHPDTIKSIENVATAYLAAAARQAWFSQDQEFADTCRRALAFAEGTKDPLVADRVAKACSLRPLVDQARRDAALALARSAVQLGAKHPLLVYFQMALGMTEYRAGHFAEADTELAAAMTEGKGITYISGTGAFYRAMSLFRQGKRDEARRLATTAAVTMKPLPKDEQNPQADKANHDDLILWLAYKEAKELIGFDATPSAAPRESASPAPEKN